jgi:outer membrane immunogenic protein
LHSYYAYFCWLNSIANQYSSIDTPILNVEKRMKKIQLAMLTASIIGMSATVANAQSKFDGAYGQVGVGYESVAPSYSNSNFTVVGVGTAPINTSISNANGFTGVVTVGYMATITKDFLLGIGAEYSPIAGQKANYSGSVLGTSLGNGSYNKENSYNIFLSPATPIGADGLLYGKVGYTGATIKDTFGSSSTNTNYTGYSLGLGYKQIIQGGLYGFGEFNYMSYGNQTASATGTVSGYTVNSSVTSNANAYNLIVGLGYKF